MFLGSGAMKVTPRTWAGIGGAVANDQGIVPTNEAFFEVGHGFHLDNHWIDGLESVYQQHWYWYTGAHVLTLSTTQIAYLPHRLSLTLSVTGARTGFVGTPAGWEPSGWIKPGFPVLHRLAGFLLYGVGSLDLLTFVAVPVVLVFVACFAILLPAHRATKVDPMVALRYE